MSESQSPDQPARMGLAQQLGFLLVIPIALALGTYGYVSHMSRQRVLMTEASAELRNHATLVEEAVGGAVERGEVQVLKERLERLARADRILGIAAFDARGEPILVTDHLAGATSLLAGFARRASAGTDFEEPCQLEGGPTLVRTVTFSSKASGPVVTVVARDLGYVDTLGNALNRGLLATGIALLLVTALMVMLLTRAAVGRPAAAIVAGAERIAGGDLGTTVPEQGAEELARLARAFNTMTRALCEARTSTEHEVVRRISEEAGRVAAERKLQHTRALAAVGQVAASIAHEIGSPLGVILGRARLLAEERASDAPMRKDLDTIAEQSERISRVVARLLAVARPPKATTESSNVARVVADVLQFLGPECRQRKIEPRVECKDPRTRVALDPDQLFQVLFNLCWNAIEVQPDGGELTIRISPIVNVNADGASSRVTIEVADSGPGVPPDLAARIFEPFFTTKSDRSGSGLGLDIVSGIVQEVGGSVALVQLSQRGACFRVTLPSTSAQPVATPTDLRAFGT